MDFSNNNRFSFDSVFLASLLPPASVGGKVIVSICLSIQGYPGQVQMGGGYLVSPDGGVPWPGSDWGTPARSRWGYPGQRWGTPWSKDGVPKPRPADGVLDTQRAVCPLRSRRGDFLLNNVLSYFPLLFNAQH